MVIKTFLTTRLNVSCCPLMCEHLIIIQIDYDLRCFEPQHQRTFFIIKMLFIFQTLYMKWNKKKMLNGTHAFYEVIATLTTMNIPDNLELSNIAEDRRTLSALLVLGSHKHQQFKSIYHGSSSGKKCAINVDIHEFLWNWMQYAR